VPDAEYLAWRVRGRNIVIDETLEARPGCPENEYGLRVVRSLDEGLSERPDAVIIANPVAMHCGTALAAAKAGSAVFIEKPLSDTWEGVDELLALTSRSGAVSFVAYQARFHPVLLRVKALLDARRLGAPLSARLHFGEHLPDMHPYEDYRESHAARRDEGGGVILCLSHEIDVAVWLFGMPSSVYAAGGHLSALDMDVEDTALITMACRDGVRPLPVAVSLDFVRRPPQRGGEIVCERGTIRWDLREPSWSVYFADERRWDVETLPDFQRNQLFLDEMSHFLGCLDTGHATLIPAAAGAKTLKVALAAKASLDTSQPVTLDGRHAVLHA
jgi:predicted dehydrogenase